MRALHGFKTGAIDDLALFVMIEIFMRIYSSIFIALPIFTNDTKMAFRRCKYNTQ
jgi:preprotein translocase subunit SecF